MAAKEAFDVVSEERPTVPAADTRRAPRTSRPAESFHVVVVGPMPLDEIVGANGTVQWHYGGAVYALAAYAALASDTSDCVTLVSHVATEDADWLRHTFGGDPHVDLSGVRAEPGDGTRITLYYLNQHRRRGVQRRQMAPIQPEDLRPFLSAHAFIFLPLTAAELPVETLCFLRENSGGLILLDAHGPLTRVAPAGERQRVAGSDVWRYLSDVDLVKMNSSEAALLFGELPSVEAYAGAAARLLLGRVRVVWVTYGDQSSLVVWRRRGRNTAYWARVPTVTGLGPVQNTTGAGDAASAGFMFAYLRTHGLPLLSAIAGNAIGSLRVVTPGGLELPERRWVRALVINYYGDYLRSLVKDFLSQSGVMIHSIHLGQWQGDVGAQSIQT